MRFWSSTLLIRSASLASRLPISPLSLYKYGSVKQIKLFCTGFTTSPIYNRTDYQKHWFHSMLPNIPTVAKKNMKIIQTRIYLCSNKVILIKIQRLFFFLKVRHFLIRPIRKERSLMVRWVVGSILHWVDPLSYFSFQPVLHDWCNKGCGMYYPVFGMVHIKEPLLLIDKSSLCGSSGFPFSLSEWSLTYVI